MTARIFEFPLWMSEQALLRRTTKQLRILLGEGASQGEIKAVLDRYAAEVHSRRDAPNQPSESSSDQETT